MKWFISFAAVALCAVGIFISGASAGENPPKCHTVTIEQNSGNGPVYHNVKACDTGRPVWIVDGGPLKSGAVIMGEPGPSPSPSPSPATLDTLSAKAVNGLPDLAGCFGHHGVQLSTHIAYECIDQSVSGGALYWSANESNFNWDKHPAQGLDWVEASTLHPTSDSNPANTKQSFWVGIAHNGAFCTVVNPGYDQHPTQCEENGTVHTMTSKQQASYDAFAAAMTAANIPDCAWSMTIVSDQCDVD